MGLLSVRAVRNIICLYAFQKNNGETGEHIHLMAIFKIGINNIGAQMEIF